MDLLKILNTKAKTFVVFLFSLISVGILIVSTIAISCVFKEWYGIIAGILLMLVAIPFHCVGKRWQRGYLISYLINSLANGFSLSALYTSKVDELDLYTFIFAAIPSAGILLLVYLMLQTFNKTKKVTVTVACVLNTVVVIVFIFFLIQTGHILFNFGFFCSLISFFYLCVFGVTINHPERSVFRDISFGSFGSFIILTVVVIFILSEGEILDGVDFGGTESKKKKQKR